jgi:dolichyl-phosphate beta-glucosyltransferase
MSLSTSPVFLSVVVPAFNEQDRITPPLRAILAHLDARGWTYELIVVDDGSTDATVAVVRQVAAGNERVRVVSYPRNRGKGCAVRTGILQTTGRYVLFTDADGSIPIDEIDSFMPYCREGYDLVIGTKKASGANSEVRQPWLRRALGRGFTALSGALLTRGITDVTCGFKCYGGDVARGLYAVQRLNDWSFDTEVLFIAQRRGYRIKEVPVRWHHDPRSRVRVLHAVVRSLAGLVEIFVNEWSGRYRAAESRAEARVRA